jgi:RNA polymerase sigma-70 factor (ECF subfamily)
MEPEGAPPGRVAPEQLAAPLDDATLEAVFRAHRQRLFGYLLRRTRHPERAEDLTQQVFLEAARERPAVGGGEVPLVAWLYMVARRRFLDDERRSLPTPVSDVEVAVLDDDVLYGREVARGIRLALGRVSAKDRDLLSARLLEGVSFAELADRHGVTQSAMKMRFVRALKELQLELKKIGVER